MTPIEWLRLTNFRCFDDFELILHPRCTVLIGANGSGKSSILDGLAVALGAWFLGFADIPARSIRSDEIRRLTFWHEGQAFSELQYPARVEARHQGVAWARALNRSGGRTTSGEARELKEIAAQSQREVAAGAAASLPMIAYYGTGRLWVQKRESSTKDEGLGARVQGYVDCLEPASNHKLLEHWMRWRERVRAQAVVRAARQAFERSHDRSRAQKDLELVMNPPHLTCVRDAVVRCVGGATDFFYNQEDAELQLEMEDGQRRSFSQLSDGYRNLVALVADIAWRAARLNPHLGVDAAKQTEGTVLIDEVDLHLHPRWQRSVLGDLLSIFPKLQFIVTTHSPQILSSARGEWVRLLEDGTARSVGPTWGRDSNALLEDILGDRARALEAEVRVRELFALIAKEHYEIARQRLDALLGQMGPDDPDLVRARWLLDVEDPEGPR